MWSRLGIGAAIRRIAQGRRLDPQTVERVIFTLVAQRALEPGSKLAATGWVADRVAITDITELTDDQAYRGMDFLLAALPEIAGEVFGSVAHLLNLDLDIIFVDTTSTYFETESPDQLPELQVDPGDDQVSNPTEAGHRTFGHSKDHRPDLPQIRVVETATGDTWRTIAHELDRLYLVTLVTTHGRVCQRTSITTGQRKIPTALNLPEPPTPIPPLRAHERLTQNRRPAPTPGIV